MVNMGIDYGNSHVKATNGAKNIIFESGYICYPESTGVEEEMEWNGQFYVLGKRGPVEFQKTRSDRMLACTLYAAVQLLEASGVAPAKTQAVNLGTDIAICSYGTEKEKYLAYYNIPEQTVTYHGNTWNIRFDQVRTYPQGVVAWAANQEKLGTYNKLLLLDIGGRTVDVAVMTYDRFSDKKGINTRLSLQNGILSLFGAIDERLQSRGIQLEEKDMELILYGEEFRHQDGETIRAIISDEARKYVQNLAADLYEKKIDTQLPVVLIGGGAHMLYPTLDLAGMDIVTNMGVMANAQACLDCLQSQL